MFLLMKEKNQRAYQVFIFPENRDKVIL